MGERSDHWWSPTLHKIWSKDRPNILAPEFQERLEAAFQRGIVFGLHQHFFGERSLDTWAFRTFDLFTKYIQRSRPGDLYTVWSLPDLVARGAVLPCNSHMSSSTGTLVLSEADLQKIETYLKVPFNEFIAIFAAADTNNFEILLNDIDGYEVIVEYAQDYDRSDDEVYVLPFTHIDMPEYIYLKAKYPNERGEVPIGGAY